MSENQSLNYNGALIPEEEKKKRGPKPKGNSKSIDFNKDADIDTKALNLDAIEKQKQALKTLNNRTKPNASTTTPVDADKYLSDDVVEDVTAEQVHRSYHKKINNETAQLIADKINKATKSLDKEGLSQYFSDISIGYLDILGDNKRYGIDSYITAAKFLAFKAAGNSTISAYCKTFPDRVRRIANDGLPESHLNSYAYTYEKSKLVTQMQAAIAVPVHILYQDIFNKAVHTQADLMLDTNIRPDVRQKAADSLMNHLKKPEVKEMQLNVGIKESSVLEDFKESMAALAAAQAQSISKGMMSVNEVASTVVHTIDKDE